MGCVREVLEVRKRKVYDDRKNYTMRSFTTCIL
jgi:hypothetical protein